MYTAAVFLRLRPAPPARASPLPPAGMAQSILDRIRATDETLTALAGLPQCVERSRSQRQGIEVLLGSTSLQIHDLAPISSALAASRFRPDDKQALLEACARASIGSASGIPSSGSKNQNYETIVSMLTESLWSGLGGESGPADLWEHMLQLGCRYPSEPTMQVAALSLMVSTDGVEKVQRMSQAARTAAIKAAKAWFKRMADRAMPPIDAIKRLPATPAELRNIYPNTYARAFATEGPTSSKIDPMVLEVLRNGSPMRQNKSNARSNMLSLTDSGGASSSQPDLHALIGGLTTMLQTFVSGGAARGERSEGLSFTFPKRGSLTNGVGFSALEGGSPPGRRPDGAPPPSGSAAPPPSGPAAGESSQATPERTAERPNVSPQTLNAQSSETSRMSVITAADTIASAYAASAAAKAEAKSKARKEKAEEKQKAKAEANADKKGVAKADKKGVVKNADKKGVVKKGASDTMGSAAKGVGKPSYSHEGSRKQFLVRSGLKGPGQSQAFVYTAGMSKAKAEASAKAHCRDLCKKLGLAVDPKFL